MARLQFIYYSLEEAVRAGFHVYDFRSDGYLVRRRDPCSDLWELALVKIRAADIA